MKKQRIGVNVWPAQKKLLQRIAVARKTSVSKVVFELITASEDALEKLAVILEAASKADAEYRRGFRQVVDQTAVQVEETYTDLFGKLEDLEKKARDLKH
jgi:uncharacterized protein (DUF1778 family)